MTKRERGRAGSKGSRGGVRSRLEMALVALVLLGVGALLGSFWLEWRGAPTRGPAADRPRGEPPLEGRPRVEVLNGAGDPGAARQAADHLRARGFDVVYFGNAESFDHAATRVLDRSGREDKAGEVARTLGLDSAVTRPEPELYLDATVILGSDWRETLASGGEAGQTRAHGRDADGG